MSFANLQITLNADLAQLLGQLDQAAKLSDQAAQKIQKSADGAGQALGDASNAADFSGMSKSAQDAANSIDGISTASAGAGTAVGALTSEVRKLLDQISAESKAKAEQIGTGTKVAIAAATVGAIYVLKEIGETFLATGLRAAEAAAHVAEFGIGLFTGSSLTSKYIDGLVEANKRVQDLQTSLAITAASASVLELALARIGTPKDDFTAVYAAADKAIHGNADAFNLLGIAYQDANGKALATQTVIQNASKVLDTYTAGVERNNAAAALGLGSADKVAAAARLNGEDFRQAGQLLKDYYLIMGPGGQKAVADYQEQMRLFRSETDLTSQGLNRAVADAITPTITEFAELARSLQGYPDAVGVAREAMTGLLTVFEGLELGVKAFKATADSTWNALTSSTTTAFGAIDKAIHLDFTAVLQEVKDGSKAIGDEFDRLFAKISSNRDKALGKLDLASGKDSQNAPAGIEQQPGGKAFFGPIDFGYPDKPAGGRTGGANVDVAKKQLEQQLKELELFVSKSKELQTTLDGFFATDYQQGEVSLRDYFDAIASLRADNLQKTRDSYAAEIAATEDYIAKTRANPALSQDQRDARTAEAKTKLIDIQGKLAKAESDAAVAGIKDADARKVALREYGEQLKDLEAQIEAFSGNTARAFEIAFDKQHRLESSQYRSVLNSPNSTKEDRTQARQGLYDIAQIREQGVAMAKLNDLYGKRSVILDDLANQLAMIDLGVQRGTKSELQGLADTSAANAAKLEKLQEIIDVQQKIAEGIGDPFARSQALVSVEKLRVEFAKLKSQTNLVADAFNDAAKDVTVNFLGTLTDRTTTARQKLKGLLDDIEKRVLKQGNDAIGNYLFGKDGGLLSGAGKQFASLFSSSAPASALTGSAATAASAIDKVGDTGAQAASGAAFSTAIEAAGVAFGSAADTAGIGFSTATNGAATGLASALQAAATAFASTIQAAATSFAATVTASDAGDALEEFGSIAAIASAKGNVFAGGNVIPFARGGIIDQKTIVPMAMMGEVGPEAIVPLRRGRDGSLGIAASGGSSAGSSGGRQRPVQQVVQHFNITAAPNRDLRSQKQIARAALDGLQQAASRA